MVLLDHVYLPPMIKAPVLSSAHSPERVPRLLPVAWALPLDREVEDLAQQLEREWRGHRTQTGSIFGDQ